ncbi:MAG: hypothetical protein EPN99_03810 [Frankiales bacterium]|nr:MAG: hypothetical protein EPN99_03810 [Frankiales bacterium]
MERHRAARALRPRRCHGRRRAARGPARRAARERGAAAGPRLPAGAGDGLRRAPAAALSGAPSRVRPATVSSVRRVTSAAPALGPGLDALLTSRLRRGLTGTVLEKRTATIVFDAVDGGVWTVEIGAGRGRARRGSAANPTLVVRSTAGTLTDVVRGAASGVTAFLDGDLTVRGDLALSLQLDGLFAHDADRPAEFARAEQTTAMGVRASR